MDSVSTAKMKYFQEQTVREFVIYKNGMHIAFDLDSPIIGVGKDRDEAVCNLHGIVKEHRWWKFTNGFRPPFFGGSHVSEPCSNVRKESGHRTH